MKPPKAVKLGPYTIPIVFDREAMRVAGGNGAYNPDMSTIVLQDNNSLDVERDTVLHELLHAIWQMTNLTKRYPDQEEDSDGEKIIMDLSPRILELLQRNPALVRYLLGP